MGARIVSGPASLLSPHPLFFVPFFPPSAVITTPCCAIAPQLSPVSALFLIPCLPARSSTPGRAGLGTSAQPPAPPLEADIRNSAVEAFLLCNDHRTALSACGFWRDMFRKTCPNCVDNHLWPPEYHPPVCQEITETNPSPEVKESRSELAQPAFLRR